MNLKLFPDECCYAKTNVKDSFERKLKSYQSTLLEEGGNKKYFTFTTDTMQTIFLYAFYANSRQAPGAMAEEEEKGNL